MLLTNAFYWDRNEEPRLVTTLLPAHEKDAEHESGRIYSATTHYLKAVEAAGTDETEAVMAKMRSTPINDFFVKNGTIRGDGRMVHQMYLYEVKKPAESRGRGITTSSSPRSPQTERSSRCQNRNARW